MHKATRGNIEYDPDAKGNTADGFVILVVQSRGPLGEDYARAEP